MKKLLALLLVAFVGLAQAEAVVKEVCHDKLDKAGKPVMKNGKAVQDCKKIKTHKKLDGEKIPDKK